jgi:flagellar protein FlaG
MNINSSIPALESTQAVQAVALKPAQAKAVAQQGNAEVAAHRHSKGGKVAELQSILSEHDISMKFTTNEDTNEVVVRLVNDKTGEIIRQIPNEVTLKLAAANIKLQGNIVDEQA